jgi:hypothetical protein
MGSLQKLFLVSDFVQFSHYFTNKIKSNFVGFFQNHVSVCPVGQHKMWTESPSKIHVKQNKYFVYTVCALGVSGMLCAINEHN